MIISNRNDIRLGEYNTLQTCVLVGMTIYNIGKYKTDVANNSCSMPRDPKYWNTVKGGYTC